NDRVPKAVGIRLLAANWRMRIRSRELTPFSSAMSASACSRSIMATALTNSSSRSTTAERSTTRKRSAAGAIAARRVEGELTPLRGAVEHGHTRDAGRGLFEKLDHFP